MSAPLEFVEPRETTDGPTASTSWISAANGGERHVFRSPTGCTSYISYSTRVVSAPTSR